MNEVAVARKEYKKGSVQTYLGSISRIDLKHEAYEARQVVVIKQSDVNEAERDAFYLPAVMLLQKIYETQ